MELVVAKGIPFSIPLHGTLPSKSKNLDRLATVVQRSEIGSLLIREL